MSGLYTENRPAKNRQTINIQKKIISDLPTLIFSRYETGTTGIFFKPDQLVSEFVGWLVHLVVRSVNPSVGLSVSLLVGWLIGLLIGRSGRQSGNMFAKAILSHHMFQTCYWPGFAQNRRTVCVLAICERTSQCNRNSKI